MDKTHHHTTTQSPQIPADKINHLQHATWSRTAGQDTSDSEVMKVVTDFGEVEEPGSSFEAADDMLALWVKQTESQSMSDIDWASRLFQLENQLKQEGLLHDSKVKENLRMAWEAQKNREMEPLKNRLSDLLNTLKPIDVGELDKICQYSEPTLEKIRGQEATFLIGRTGHGKSTLLHKLMGSDFEEVKQHGAHHLNPIPLRVRGDSIQHIQTSPEVGVSTTSSVDAIDIWTDPSNPNSKSAGWFCDTPGFSDRRGPTIDIANMLSLTQAMQACSAVRVVLLVSAQDLGARFELLDSLIEDLIRFHPSFTDYLDELYIVVRLGDHLNPEDFLAKVKSYHSKLGKRPHPPSQPFMNFVQGIIDKLEQDEILFSDFANKKESKKLVKALTQRNKQRKHTLTLPKELYGLPVDEASQLAIQNQANRYKTSLEYSLKQGKDSLVKHRLNQLRILSVRLKTGELRNAYDHACDRINSFFKELYRTTTESFKVRLEDGASLKPQDVEDYAYVIRRVEQFLNQLGDHHDLDPEKVVSGAAYRTIVSSTVRHMQDFCSIYQSTEVRWTKENLHTTLSYLVKMGRLAYVFPRAQEALHVILKDLEVAVDQFIQQTAVLIQSSDFEAIGKALSAAQLIDQTFSTSDFSLEKSVDLYIHLLDLFHNGLTEKAQHILDLLPSLKQEESVGKRQLSAVNDFFEMTDQLLESTSMREHLDRSCLSQFQASIETPLLAMTRDTVQNINEILSSNTDYSIVHQLTFQFMTLSDLSNISSIKAKVEQISCVLRHKIDAKVSRLSDDVIRISSSLLINDQPIDDTSFLENMRKLKELNDFLEQHGDFLKGEDVFQKITNNLSFYIKKLEKSFDRIDVTWGCQMGVVLPAVHEPLVTRYEKFTRIHGLCHKDSVLQSFIEQDQSIIDKIQSKLKYLLGKINQVLHINLENHRDLDLTDEQKMSKEERQDLPETSWDPQISEYDLDKALIFLNYWGDIELEDLDVIKQQAVATKIKLINQQVDQFYFNHKALYETHKELSYFINALNTGTNFPDESKAKEKVQDCVQAYKKMKSWDNRSSMLQQYKGKLPYQSALDDTLNFISTLADSIKNYIQINKNQLSKLQHGEPLIRACYELDFLLDKDRKAFSQLQTEYYTVFNQRFDALIKEIQNALTTGNYNAAANTMRLLQNKGELNPGSDNYQNLENMTLTSFNSQQQTLHAQLLHLRDFNLGQLFTNKSLESLKDLSSELMRHLNDFKNFEQVATLSAVSRDSHDDGHASDHMTFPLIAQHYTDCVKDCRQQLTKYMHKQSHAIKQMLTYNDFSTAHTSMGIFSILKIRLESWFDPESPQNSLDIPSTMQNIFQTFRDEKPFSSWDKYEISLHLEQVKGLSKVNQQYEGLLQSWMDLVHSQVRKELNDVGADLNQLKHDVESGNHASRSTQSLENAYHDFAHKLLKINDIYSLLPTDDQIERKIKKYEEKLQKDIYEDIILFQQSIQNHDLRDLKDKIKHAQGTRRRKIKDYILKNFKISCIDEIKRQWCQNPVDLLKNNRAILSQVVHYDYHFSNFPDFKKAIDQLRTDLGMLVHNQLLRLRKHLADDPSMIPLSTKTWSEDFNAWIALDDFVQLYYREPSDSEQCAVLNLLFSSDILSQLERFHEHCISSLLAHSQNYLATVEGFKSAESIENALNLAKRWQPYCQQCIDHLTRMEKDQHRTFSSQFTQQDFSKTMASFHMTYLPYTILVQKTWEVFAEQQKALTNTELINHETRYTEDQRRRFYKKMLSQLEIFRDLKALDLNPPPEIRDSFSHLSKELLQSVENIRSQAEKILARSTSLKESYQELNIVYVNIKAFDIYVGQHLSWTNGDVLKNLEQAIQCKIEDHAYRTSSELSQNNVAKNMIVLQVIAITMEDFAADAEAKIKDWFRRFKDNHQIQELLDLRSALECDPSGMGSVVLDTQSLDFPPKPFLLARHGIDHVIEQLTVSCENPRVAKKEKVRWFDIPKLIDELINFDSSNFSECDEHGNNPYFDKNLLRKGWDDDHWVPYQNNMDCYLDASVDESELVNIIKEKAQKVQLELHADTGEIIEWNPRQRKIATALVGGVLTLWSKRHAKFYLEMRDKGLLNAEQYKVIPHAAQIVTIMSLLKLYNPPENTAYSNQLINHLAQVKTGEGKSLILSVLSSVLALMGADIYCACYSEYLSERDYKDFQWLFELLDIESKVHYGTFQSLCEKVINRDGDVRGWVLHTIDPVSPIPSRPDDPNRLSVLLVDEVDIFFRDDFYGNMYTPSTQLRHATVTKLIQYIWNHRNHRFFVQDVEKTSEYQACCQQFPQAADLIREAVKNLLFDARNFNKHPYEVHQSQIAYKVQDSIRYNVTCRYNTVCAALFEHERERVSQSGVDRHMCLNFSCGNLPYDQIPQTYFHLILGVTGTLADLGQQVKDIMRVQYQIKMETYQPSVFPKSNLRFARGENVLITDRADYFLSIFKEIKTQRGLQRPVSRPVIVFFKNEQALEDFYNAHLQSYHQQVQKMTEKLTFREKQSFIVQATMPGTMTLAIADYMRGTDFISRDHAVKSHGGVHVLLTFWTVQSDRIQSMGRTARQGEEGSFSMILQREELTEQLQLTSQEFEIIQQGGQDGFKDLLKQRGLFKEKGFFKKWLQTDHFKKRIELAITIYDKLEIISEAIFSKKFMEQVVAVRDNEHIFAESRRFLDQLRSQQHEPALNYLLEANRGVQVTGKSRTILFMDATGSMSSLIGKCKKRVGEMLKRLVDVLSSKNLQNAFLIKFAAYRNYNSDYSKILQASEWTQNPTDLQHFLNGVHSEGGYGYEAIEVAFQHVNDELRSGHLVSQVLLIGDVPPNTEQDVIRNRSIKGEGYWKPKLGPPTFFKRELDEMKQHNPDIKVNTFFVDTCAQVAFQEIANKTKGVCQFLDINSDKGAEDLTHAVNLGVLEDVGDQDVIDQYRMTYMS